jgi:lipopolysaccharide transport system ATP-binding protein
MSNIAISCEQIGKRYRLGETVRYGTLRDAIHTVMARGAGRLRAPFLSGSSGEPAAGGEFWALRNISFGVDAGEAVAVIGHNGAGKSTLLKVLARITAPTEGRAVVRGRLGSLLEVGTGFHPELTGRENVLLSGAILGMSRREVRDRFDRIVEFAGVEAFLDTPVKRYSSGMHLRLAFSVAAHLEPDILLVDEVLAVGDAAFQRKCLGKLGEVGEHGRTVVFVSHNLGLVRTLCTRGIVLESGRLVFDGPIERAIAEYSSRHDSIAASVDLRSHPGRTNGGSPLLERLDLRDRGGRPATDFAHGDTIVVDITYDALAASAVGGAGIILERSDGLVVGNVNTFMHHAPPWALPASGRIRFALEAAQLIPDQYSLTVTLARNSSQVLDQVVRAAGFSVYRANANDSGYQHGRGDGAVMLRAEVHVEGELE